MLEFVNWIFVSIYWTLLMDLGQTAPVEVLVDYSGLGYPVPDPFPITNNIFANPTLFNIYYAYLNTTILPILSGTSNITLADAGLPWFQPISAAEILSISNSATTFIQSYNCAQRQWKKWLEAIADIILADYALIGAPYMIAGWIAVWLQRRVRRDCERHVNDANLREPLRGVFGKSQRR
jgi:hypothetical protein